MFSKILMIMSILGVCWTQTTSSDYCIAHTSRLLTGKENMCPAMTNLDPRHDNHPWTHQTHCITASEFGNVREQTYCLYTKENSGSRRGFSIVTTPELARTLSLKDTKSDRTKGSEQFTLNATESTYEARETGGRGVGLFSTVKIHAGQVILTDSPAFIAMRDALDALPRTERQEMQWRGVLQLPKADQKLFRNLAKSRGGDEIDDILQTNSIGLSLGGNHGYLAVMPEAARINHSCRPNAYYRFNETTYCLEVFALRDIDPGEEFTFSYGYAEMTQEKRHQFLKTHWGFDCTCTLCSASAEIISTSDNRINQINQLQEKLSDGSRNHRIQLAIVAKLLRLFDEEGLIIPKAKYCEIGAYAANQMGDEKQAKKYGELAQSYWSIVAGSNSWEVQRIEELLRDPKGHPSWRPKIDVKPKKVE